MPAQAAASVAPVGVESKYLSPRKDSTTIPYREMAATLISRGKDTEFTILPYDLGTPIEKELATSPSNRVLGYVSADRKFFFVDSNGFTEAANHWSLELLKQHSYHEEEGPWIVYNGPPKKVATAFGKIVGKYAQALHIHDWDIWSVAGKDGCVAVITEWEIY